SPRSPPTDNAANDDHHDHASARPHHSLTDHVAAVLTQPVGEQAWMEAVLASPFGATTVGLLKEQALAFGGLMLTDLGRAAVEKHLDPRLLGVVEQLDPVDGSMLPFSGDGIGVGARLVAASGVAIRIRDEGGRLAGTVIVFKPAAGMTTLASLAMNSDAGHLERMLRVAKAARRPAAILFADLEGSSPLARRLPTASYFALSRRLVRAADHHVISSGGLVGRHVGDGLAAFFLAETAGTESAAARACIAAARAVRDAVPDIARRSDLGPDDVVVRMGLHWGATLYVGNITSEGRSEVTAMGDEVNEAARIEACAMGGRVLASKNLIERLSPDVSVELDIDTSRIAYTTLAELPHATEKARRDAPAIAVCEI
nr:adenylate/guanylate cyclase domain-containing protein [Acidimicrobiia bacterium]